MWLSLAFTSAVLLGVYDLFKKMSLEKNAVIPVLFLNTLFCTALLAPVALLSRIYPAWMESLSLYLPTVPLEQHLYIFLKAVIVLSSWLFAYYAMKHLPITIASPIKASQPILTLLGATLLFGERLNLYQWIGVITTIAAFLLLSRAGKKEGIRFAYNRWVWCILLAIITGAISGLYDKYLMSHGFDRMGVQLWYTFYQMLLMGVILGVIWLPQHRRGTTTPFQWRWSILGISLFLILADFIYFYALSMPDSMISIVSMVRRSGVIVSFLGGMLLFREKNIRTKAVDLLLVLLGMFFLYLGSR